VVTHVGNLVFHRSPGGPKGATARLAWAAATAGALSDPGYYAPEHRYRPRSEPVWLTRPD